VNINKCHGKPNILLTFRINFDNATDLEMCCKMCCLNMCLTTQLRCMVIFTCAVFPYRMHICMKGK